MAARLRRWMTLLVLIALVGGGIYYYRKKAEQDAQPKTETAEIFRGDVQSRISATGKLQAVTQITVGSQVSGIVQTLYVDFNTRVKKGQPLAQLDPSTFRAQLEQTTASVNSALSDLSNQQANVGNQAANVRSAQAAVASAQAKVDAALGSEANSRASVVTAEANLRKGMADLVLAKRNEQRQATLRERDLIATSELDTAKTTTLTSQANVDSLKSQVEAARAGLRSSQANTQAARAEVDAARMRVDAATQQLAAARAQVQGAQARVSQARANQSQAEVNLNFATIRSPIDGIVLDRKVTVGQTVAAQFQAPDLFTLAENLDLLQVQVAVDEADIGQVKQGAEVNFTVDAFPNDRFKGTVHEIRQSPVLDQNVVTYTVIVDTRNPKNKLKPGMTATVNIEVESREDVLLVPNSALRFRPTNAERGARRRPMGQRTPRPEGEPRERQRRSTVYTKDLKPHRFVPGISDGVNTEITGDTDLDEGDEVITSQTTSGNATTGAPGGQQRGGGRRGGPRMF